MEVLNKCPECGSDLYEFEVLACGDVPETKSIEKECTKCDYEVIR